MEKNRGTTAATAATAAATNGYEDDNQNADIDATDDEGWTALMRAANDGDDARASALIRANANLEKQSHKGTTALMVAARGGHEQIMRTLIDAKANMEAVDNRQRTALMFAARNGQTTRMLLNAQADIEAVDRKKQTALMYAAMHGFVEVVQALIEAGANVHHANKKKQTALSMATDRRIVDLLIENKATMPRLCENNDFDDDEKCVTDGILFSCLKDRVIANAHDNERLTCYFDPEEYPRNPFADDPMTRGPFEPVDVSYLVSKLLKNVDGTWKLKDDADKSKRRKT